MRTIIIEPAPNGWIVREYLMNRNIVPRVLGVYVDTHSLQAALPTLLDIDIITNIPVEFVEVGGDRTPETIGGKELTPSS